MTSENITISTTVPNELPDNNENGKSINEKRRSVLKGLVTLICAAEVPGWVFAGDISKPSVFLSNDELSFITSLADTFIPTTDTPGAVEAGVPIGFDRLMTGWASGDRQSVVRQTIKALADDLDQRVGRIKGQTRI